MFIFDGALGAEGAIFRIDLIFLSGNPLRKMEVPAGSLPHWQVTGFAPKGNDVIRENEAPTSLRSGYQGNFKQRSCLPRI
jgi:hypothetical protein